MRRLLLCHMASYIYLRNHIHVTGLTFQYGDLNKHNVTYLCVTEKPPRFRQNESAQKQPPRDDNRELQRTEIDFRWLWFLPCCAMLVQYMLSLSVHLFVLSQAGIVLKQQGELYWFLAWRLHSTYPTPCSNDPCVWYATAAWSKQAIDW